LCHHRTDSLAFASKGNSANDGPHDPENGVRAASFLAPGIRWLIQ
jgi:hypothetical protein